MYFRSKMLVYTLVAFCVCVCVCVCAGDRSHVVERKHDTKKNETEQNRELINLDEGKLVYVLLQDNKS